MTRGRKKYNKYEWCSQENGIETMKQSNSKFAYEVHNDEIYILPHTTFYIEQEWRDIYSNSFPAPKGREVECHKPSGPHGVKKPEYIFHFEKIIEENISDGQVDTDREKAIKYYVSVKDYICRNITDILANSIVKANDPNQLCIQIIIEKEVYFVTLFENDLDTDSGNMHTFYGQVQFWKLTSENKLLTRNTYGSQYESSVAKGRELRFLLKDSIHSRKKEYVSAMSGSLWKGNDKIIYLDDIKSYDSLLEEFKLFVSYTKYM